MEREGFNILLLPYQPVLHVLHGALALEVELHIIQGIANLLERCFGIETGIA